MRDRARRRRRCRSASAANRGPGAGSGRRRAILRSPGPGPAANRPTTRRPGPSAAANPSGPPRRGSPRWDDSSAANCGRMSSMVVASRAFCSPWAEPAPRLGIVPPPQLDHHLLRRLVLHRPKLLEHRQPAGFQLVLGQVRAAQHVGVDGQRLRQVLGHAWRRCSWYGRSRPTRSAPRPGCPGRG